MVGHCICWTVNIQKETHIMPGILNWYLAVCKIKVTVFDYRIYSFGLCLYVPPLAIQRISLSSGRLCLLFGILDCRWRYRVDNQKLWARAPRDSLMVYWILEVFSTLCSLWNRDKLVILLNLPVNGMPLYALSCNSICCLLVFER